MKLALSKTLQIALMRNYWLVVMVVVATVEAVLLVLTPHYTQQIIDAIIQHRDMGWALSGFAVVAVLVPLFGWANKIIASQSGWQASNAIRHAVGQTIFEQPIEFFRSHGVGELSERIDADSGKLQAVFGSATAQFVSAVVLIGSVGYRTWQIDIGVFSALLGYFVLGAFLIMWTQRDNHTAWEAERIADAALYDTVEENFASISDIKAVGAEPFLISRLTPRLITLLAHNRTARIQSQSAAIGATLVNAVGWLIAIGIGIWRYQHQLGSIGDAVALLGYTTLMNQPIEHIRGIVQEFQQARGVLQRLDQLYDTRQSAGATTHLSNGPISVTLTNVSFRYPTSTDWVLRDINLHIPAGSHVAFIGRTGSGKTTLGRLISRVESAQQGKVTLSGAAIAQIATTSLRQQVAVISQEVDLFNATIRDNVTCFVPDYSDHQIITALTDAGLAEWYATLPAQLDTFLGDGERELSPGEQQLLAIARVLLCHPGLVILDEATAHIDPVSQQRLSQALKVLSQQRTVITIAHRLSTIRAADKVVVLADGQIIEMGAPTTLAQQPDSHYAQLLATNPQEEV
ncbi:MAG: ABC transporter ATP-binding protein [Chloroflexales bacterium]|nr:ABC transporter ATP-binding protein [Chloroflexales bacterium]